MNVKTWIPLSAAVAFGTGAAYVGYTLISTSSTRVIVKEQKLVDVVVAARPVAAGAKLVVEDLRVQRVTPESAPKDAVAQAAVLVGRVSLYTIREGQPLGENVLAGGDTVAGLAAILPKGFRAITLEVDRFAGMNEFLKPETRVDMVSGFREGEEMAVRTVVQNVRVLAVDGLLDGQTVPVTEGGEKDRQTSATKSVTLMVTLEQAAAIELATVSGKPRLTLRAGNDGELSAFDGLTLAELRGVRPDRPSGPETGFAGVQPWDTPETRTVPISSDATTRPTTRPGDTAAGQFVKTDGQVGAVPVPPPIRFHVIEVIRGGLVSRESFPVKSNAGDEPQRRAADPWQGNPTHEYAGNDTRPADE